MLVPRGGRVLGEAWLSAVRLQLMFERSRLTIERRVKPLSTPARAIT
jgi:hypothetical protein